MRRSFSMFVLGAVLSGLPQGVGAQTPPTAAIAANTDAAVDAALPKALDAFMARVLKELEVPGISVAVVREGKVIVAKGYGVRKVGGAPPVDTHTRFQIGSNSKAFTTTALAILVDEGKLSWDDPVQKWLPDFQLYDPYVSRELTVRDLLCHRCGLGLGAGDLLWWPKSTHTREDIYHRLRFLKPESSFRSKFAYDNLMYDVAGRLFPVVAKKSWEAFIRERIFAPLQMTDTVGDWTELDEKSANIALPHQRVEGKLTSVPAFAIGYNAAGSICSSATDMARWMNLQLAGGKFPDGKAKPLFSTAAQTEFWSPQTPFSGRAMEAYGLGWFLTPTLNRYRAVTHSGGLPGMVSNVLLVPEKKLGITVLTNSDPDGGYAMEAITQEVLRHYLEPSLKDPLAKQLAQRSKNNAGFSDTVKKLFEGRAKNSKPSLVLSGYAGHFEDAWYGGATITLAPDGKTLILSFDHTPALTGKLEHFQYDTFVVRWTDRSLNADAFVTFSLDARGKVEQFKMAAVSPETDFSFDFQDLLFRPKN